MAARRNRRSPHNKENFSWVNGFALITQLGITMFMSIACFLAAGFFIDKWLNTKPIFVLIFILMGIAAGGYLVYKQIMEIIAKTDAKK